MSTTIIPGAESNFAYPPQISIVRMNPLQATSKPRTISLLLCWQAEDAGVIRTWFQTQVPHDIKQGSTVVQISDVHSLVDGIHLVDHSCWEEGASSGPTLFSILSIAEQVGDRVLYHRQHSTKQGLLSVICDVSTNSVTLVKWVEPPKVICSYDTISDDSSDSSENLVPFDSDSYGLTTPTAPLGIVSAAVGTLRLELQNKINHVCHLLRFIAHGDSSGIETGKTLSEKIMQNFELGVMQRGLGLCIVPQRLLASVLSATLAVRTSEQFQGGVLMHLLYNLEDMYSRKQVNIQTNLLEDAPDNLFEHMDGTGLTSSVLGES